MKRNLERVFAGVAVIAILGCSSGDDEAATGIDGDNSVVATKIKPPPVKPKKAIPKAPAVGMMAPDISGPDIDGVDFKLSDYRGKVVMVDFWGDW